MRLTGRACRSADPLRQVSTGYVTGRTIAAEQQVLSSIDDAGTRAIQVRAEDAAGVKSDVLKRLSNIDGIEWSAAFSAAVDATNSLVPTGTRVPVRYIYSEQLDRLDIHNVPTPGSTAYLSQTAVELFGLPDIGGAVTLTTSATAAVGGRITVPDYMSSFEPVALIPADMSGPPQTVNVVLVIAETPQLVAPVADALASVLAAEDPSKVTLETSETLAQLRSVIQSQLGSQSRALVLGLVALTALLVAATLYGLVMMRRKDFGRRRALGATRTYIVSLLVTQTALLALVGVTLGLASRRAQPYCFVIRCPRSDSSPLSQFWRSHPPRSRQSSPRSPRAGASRSGNSVSRSRWPRESERWV